MGEGSAGGGAPGGDGRAGDAAWADALLDALSIGAFSIDQPTQTILRANEAYARLLGFPSAEATVGSCVLDLYADPKERQEIATRLLADESFRRTGVARLQVRRLRQDTRTPVDLSMTLTTRSGEGGRLARVEGVFELVHEPDSLEPAFRASEARFRSIFEGSTVGMAIADLRGRVYRVNAALVSFLGRDEGELVGSDLARFLVPEDGTDLAPDVDARADAPRLPRERRFARPDGSIVVGDVTWSRLSEDDGAVHSLVLSVQDVTERRRLEDGLARMAKLESLGVLAGGIAHDFNNILAVILGNLTLASRVPDLGDEGRALLASAEEATHRARDLAKQLVTFAKGGAPHKRVGSLADVVRQTAGFCLRGSNVAVELHLPADLWPAEFDEAQIGQVVQNLLLNAAQAMPDGGRVQVVARNVELDGKAEVPVPPGRYVQLRVRDDGEGIEPANLARIFDPYFSTKRAGSGLGLATAHSIVTRHGGWVGVESERGCGSTFSVYLPATDRAERARRASSQIPAVAAARPSRVLVMDDEPNLRRIIAAVLGTQGHDADLVADGAEAVAAYRRAMEEGRPYTFVLLDLTVPGGLGGVPTLASLRAIDPGVKAIVSSGYSDDPVLADCRAHGFVGRVVKPFTADELDDAVRAVLRAR